MMRKGGLNLLAGLRQGHPGLNAEQLSSRWIAGIRGALRVNDAASRGHPINFTRLERLHRAEAVAMHDLAGEHVGDRCKTDMRMWAHFKGPALNQLQWAELIKENKGTHRSAFGRWQCPHHVEAADIAAAWHNHGIDGRARRIHDAFWVG